MIKNDLWLFLLPAVFAVLLLALFLEEIGFFVRHVSSPQRRRLSLWILGIYPVKEYPRHANKLFNLYLYFAFVNILFFDRSLGWHLSFRCTFHAPHLYAISLLLCEWLLTSTIIKELHNIDPKWQLSHLFIMCSVSFQIPLHYAVEVHGSNPGLLRRQGTHAGGTSRGAGVSKPLSLLLLLLPSTLQYQQVLHNTSQFKYDLQMF